MVAISFLTREGMATIIYFSPEKHPYQRNGHNDLHRTDSQPVKHGFGAFFDDVGEFDAHADCGEGGDFELGADGF